MSCASQTNVVVAPGPKGQAGADGTDGTDGVNAYTTTTASFVMPAELATVSVSVGTTAWMTVGQKVYVKTAGYMDVNTITDTTTVVLTNPEDSALNLYNENAAPGTSIPTSSPVSPAGIQGPVGVLSGAAGGELAGNYPNPTINVVSAKGQLFGHNGTNNIAFSAGTDKNVLHASSGQPSGLEYAGIDLNGATTNLLNQLGVANGGTGASTATAGFDALSPMTTQGDIVLGGAAGTGTRLGIGANSTVLQSNGTTASWQSVAGLSQVFGLEFVEYTTASATATISTSPSATAMGLVWVNSYAGAAVTVTLPDVDSWIANSSGKILVVMRADITLQIDINATDVGGNEVWETGKAAGINLSIAAGTKYNGWVLVPFVTAARGNEWVAISEF